MTEEHNGPEPTMTDLLGFCEHLQGHLDKATEAARIIKDQGNKPDPMSQEIDTIGANVTSMAMECDDLAQQLAIMIRVHQLGGPEAMIKNLGSWGREDN